MTTYSSEMFSHYYWFNTAVRLKYYAEVLWDKLSELYDRTNKPDNLTELRNNQLAIFQTHMMLIGFSLENIVKAVSIKSFTSSNRTVTDFKQLRKDVWQVSDMHNILMIAEKCKFDLIDAEKDLILRHTEFLIWAGRYHIPKNKTKYDKVFEEGKLRRKKGDAQLIENIFTKAKTFLE